MHWGQLWEGLLLSLCTIYLSLDKWYFLQAAQGLSSCYDWVETRASLSISVGHGLPWMEESVSREGAGSCVLVASEGYFYCHLLGKHGLSLVFCWEPMCLLSSGTLTEGMYCSPGTLHHHWVSLSVLWVDVIN